MLQIRFSSTVHDYNYYGSLPKIAAIGCAWPMGLTSQADVTTFCRSSGGTVSNLTFMVDPACNIPLATWYYFMNATGNGGANPVYVAQYCQGMGITGDVVVGLISHLMGPGFTRPADPNNAYPVGIKRRFTNLLGGLPSPDPFGVSLSPSMTQYCKWAKRGGGGGSGRSGWANAQVGGPTTDPLQDRTKRIYRRTLFANDQLGGLRKYTVRRRGRPLGLPDQVTPPFAWRANGTKRYHLDQTMTPDHCRALARYNRWMNEKLYAVASKLADSERKRDRGAFFKSIHGTLNHLLLADRVWMGRFTGVDLHRDWMGPGGILSLDQELYADFDELRRERGKTDQEIQSWIAGLSAESLAAPLRYTRKGTTYDHPLWWSVAHLFNHQTHHRGQVTTLFMQAGQDPGATDLIAMLREEASREKASAQ